MNDLDAKKMRKFFNLKKLKKKTIKLSFFFQHIYQLFSQLHNKKKKSSLLNHIYSSLHHLF